MAGRINKRDVTAALKRRYRVRRCEGVEGGGGVRRERDLGG